MNETPQRFRATNIVETIRDQGRTVTWVAKRLGVSRQYTSDVVHGHLTVAEPMAKRIAQLLDVPFFLLWKLQERNEFVPGTNDEEAA